MYKDTLAESEGDNVSHKLRKAFSGLNSCFRFHVFNISRGDTYFTLAVCLFLLLYVVLRPMIWSLARRESAI